MKTWDTEIKLIPHEPKTDEEGFPIVGSLDPVAILANRLPVYSSEFYQANREGISIEEAFEIHTMEYNGERKVEYEGREYNVRRRFHNGEFTELYCESLGGSS